MNILGISCFYHDSAAALVQDGALWPRPRRNTSPEENTIRGFRSMRSGLVSRQEASARGLGLCGLLRQAAVHLRAASLELSHRRARGLRSWLAAMPVWLGQKLHIPTVVKRELGYEGDVLFTEHHEAHAGSSFYPSPFDQAAVLTVDGVGEWATATRVRAGQRHHPTLKELHFPDSVGLLYSAFTYFTGFRVNSGEYKLMGLAPYGTPRYRDVILSELVDLKADGSLRFNLAYFDFLGGLRMTNRRFAALFGGPPRSRKPESHQREMDIAASIQAVTRDHAARAIPSGKETGSRISAWPAAWPSIALPTDAFFGSGRFDNIWIQPTAGTRGAMGSALSVWHRYLGNERPDPKGSDRLSGSYLGPAFTNEAVKDFLDRNGYPYLALDVAEGPAAVARPPGKIVGYLSGRMEFGPRALGARSILGDARREDTHRHEPQNRNAGNPSGPSPLLFWRRRFAHFRNRQTEPLHASGCPHQEERRLAQPPGDGMPLLERLKAKRSDIPAVTHLDFSARLQTVNGKDKPDYHRVISEFKKLTGCAVIVNTSFNVRGEPVTCPGRCLPLFHADRDGRAGFGKLHAHEGNATALGGKGGLAPWTRSRLTPKQ